MKEFALIFRMDIITEAAQPTEEQMKVYMQQWMEWIEEIADNGQLSEGGNHFSRQGRVLKPGGNVTDMPYVAEGVSVAGYILILAKDLDEATGIATKCPILNGLNTSVEIREVASPGQ
jgi:hypothetical protein